MTSAYECFKDSSALPGTLGALAHMAREGGEFADRPLKRADVHAFAAKLQIRDWPISEWSGDVADTDRFVAILRELGSMPGIREDWSIPARHLVARYEGKLPVPIAPIAAPSVPSAPTRLKFDDELTYAGIDGGSNRHRPRLLLQKGEALVEFAGSSIPGVIRVDGEQPVKNGKWSYTKWELSVASGVLAWTQRGGKIRPLNVDDGPSTDYQRVTRWADVTVPEAVVRHLASLTARRLDLNELEV